jgi:hypothetical protein
MSCRGFEVRVVLPLLTLKRAAVFDVKEKSRHSTALAVFEQTSVRAGGFRAPQGRLSQARPSENLRKRSLAIAGRIICLSKIGLNSETSFLVILCANEDMIDPVAIKAILSVMVEWPLRRVSCLADVD